MGNYTGPSPARSFAPVATKDRFSGDGSSVNFDLTFDIPSGGFNSLNVYVEDVWQEPTVAYTVGNDGSGNPRRVTFTSAPPSGTNNIVIINRDRETARVIPDASSVGSNQLNAEMITGQTEVTAVGADHVLIYDANQTSLKKALVSTLGNTVSNSANNRILTDTGTTGSINAESNLTFDGSTLALTGSQTVSGTVTAAGFTIGSAEINETELEILDGATISTNELNTLASIGSDSVATQLATKAPLASPALTGTATGVNLTLSGNLIVNGTTTTVATTNTTVSDNMLELNTGSSSNANDCGIVIERGSTGDNAIIAWDESVDRFIVGTTTATGASTGDLTITAGKLEVSGIVIGSADINEAELEILDGATVSTTELNRVVGVTSGIQTQLDAKLALAGGTMTGDLILGDNIKIELGDATGGDLQIYHDGSDSYIADASTGSLKLLTDTFRVQNPGGTENMIVATENSGVSLHFDNDAKLTTVTGGVNITGTATATTFSGSGASLTSLPAANVTGQLTPSTGSTGITMDYDSLPTSDPGVKGRIYRTTYGVHQVLAVSGG
tara:strand:+ start:66 stop:1742 length:1677 start_codon:yes stop_codon:yes gene_type:complete